MKFVHSVQYDLLILTPSSLNTSSRCGYMFSDEDNDEDENGLYYLPAAPEIDDPDETINPDVSCHSMCERNESQ